MKQEKTGISILSTFFECTKYEHALCIILCILVHISTFYRDT